MISRFSHSLSLSNPVWCIAEECIVAWGDSNQNSKSSKMKFLRFLQIYQQFRIDKNLEQKYSAGINSMKKNIITKKPGIELIHEQNSINNEILSKNCFILDLLQKKKKKQIFI